MQISHFMWLFDIVWFQVEDTIISIPERLLITTETALESEIGDFIKR